MLFSIHCIASIHTLKQLQLPALSFAGLSGVVDMEFLVISQVASLAHGAQVFAVITSRVVAQVSRGEDHVTF